MQSSSSVLEAQLQTAAPPRPQVPMNQKHLINQIIRKLELQPNQCFKACSIPEESMPITGTTFGGIMRVLVELGHEPHSTIGSVASVLGFTRAQQLDLLCNLFSDRETITSAELVTRLKTCL